MKRALKGTPQPDGQRRRYGSIVERYDRDELYRANCQKDGMTRDEAANLDVIALQPPQQHYMSLEERKKKNKNYSHRVVQSGGGGGDTVSTRSYSDYEATRAKAKAKTSSQASSSSASWTHLSYTAWEVSWTQWW